MDFILIFWLCFAILFLILIYTGIYHHWKHAQKELLWFQITLRPSVSRKDVSDTLIPILIQNGVKHAQITYHPTKHGLNIKVTAHRHHKNKLENTADAVTKAYFEFRTAMDNKDMTMLSKECDTIHL